MLRQQTEQLMLRENVDENKEKNIYIKNLITEVTNKSDSQHYTGDNVGSKD